MICPDSVSSNIILSFSILVLSIGSIRPENNKKKSSLPVLPKQMCDEWHNYDSFKSKELVYYLPSSYKVGEWVVG